jgi:hypothetical protein
MMPLDFPKDHKGDTQMAWTSDETTRTNLSPHRKYLSSFYVKDFFQFHTVFMFDMSLLGPHPE